MLTGLLLISTALSSQDNQLSRKNQLISDQQIRNYVRKKLHADTVNWDSISFAFANSRAVYRQKQMVNALRKKDSSAKGGSLKKLMQPQAGEFFDFIVQANTGSGDLYSKALKSVEDPNFIEARVMEYRKSGNELPLPIQLPQSKNEDHFLNDVNASVVKLYPNPASEKLIVVIEAEGEPYTAQIVDSQGKLVREIQGLKAFRENKLDISSIQNGIYYLSVFSNEQKIESHAFSIFK